MVVRLGGTVGGFQTGVTGHQGRGARLAGAAGCSPPHLAVVAPARRGLVHQHWVPHPCRWGTRMGRDGGRARRAGTARCQAYQAAAPVARPACPRQAWQALRSCASEVRCAGGSPSQYLMPRSTSPFSRLEARAPATCRERATRGDKACTVATSATPTGGQGSRVQLALDATWHVRHQRRTQYRCSCQERRHARNGLLPRPHPAHRLEGGVALALDGGGVLVCDVLAKLLHHQRLQQATGRGENCMRPRRGENCMRPGSCMVRLAPLVCSTRPAARPRVSQQPWFPCMINHRKCGACACACMHA